MKDVEGKVAFITGGASGMGLAMARSFAKAGMKVVVADVEDGALERVRKEFAGSNAFLALKVDVTDRAAMAAAADETERAFGKVHVVCNNAGVAVGGPIDQMTYKDWDWVMGVNLQGVINGVQTFIERMKKHGEGGHFVNTASMAGQAAIGGLSIYSVTKYAVVGMSETMRQDLAPLNIGVSVLCPGVVSTNIFDSGRNRPAELQDVGGVDTAKQLLTPSVLPNAERDAALQAIMAGALDPAMVGDMVLEAIKNDDPYIFTHPELKAMTDTRQAQLNTSFERWATYRGQ